MKSSQISGKDITGLVSGKLTVLYQTDRKANNGHYYWTCRCSCGNVKDIIKGLLVAGNTKSCGCLRKDVYHADSKDISGLISGRLTVLYRTDRKTKDGDYYWHCLCSCGQTTDVVKGDLTRGRTKSCGCITKERVTTHGYYKHPLYKLFNGMKRRCFDLKEKCYPNYGGRGITVCDEWLNNPGLFVDWAKANGYRKGLQIDRINNDCNYEPRNCRFATPKENSLNRRNTVYVLLNGEKTLALDAAAQLGLKVQTVYRWNRLKRVLPKYQHLVTLIEDGNPN